MFTSLRLRLLCGVLLLLALLAPLHLLSDLRAGSAASQQATDDVLADWAQALAVLLRAAERPGARPQLLPGPEVEQLLRERRSERLWWALRDADGRLLAGDRVIAGDLPGAQPPDTQPQWSDRSVNGQTLRQVRLAVACGLDRPCELRVAQTTLRRDAEQRAILHALGLQTLGVVLLLGGGLVAVVAWSLWPLRGLRRDLAGRPLRELHPLDRRGLPAELAPLLDGVDHLLQRLSAENERQRHFIADAAHQLRTPLTALRTEAELALLGVQGREADPGLERLHRSALRAARLADQLLLLARTEASQGEPGGDERCDLKAVVQDAARDWVPRALERGADLGFQLEAAPVRGRAYQLRELLANLIHNALEYAGGEDGSGPLPRITVRTRQRPARPGRPALACLEVEDNGPGIPPEHRERVLERFYRAPGAPGSGSGLGLAIVHDIARAHGARLSLGEPAGGRGLRVRINFLLAD